eukprot:Phypoly_transcript_06218.p1 GENE.Phypoly_transcript_06218~~Phypoly_transcript_06218.p1  ORF type:complete len:361 (+),score=44.94 Phypoly_transcript_06218:201-1283(+)
MADSSWNVRWLLVCIVLQTILLFILFRPDQRNTDPTPANHDDRLDQALIQLAHTLNQTLVTQQQTSAQMYALQQGFSEALAKISQNPTNSHQTDLQTTQQFFTQLVEKLSQSIDSTEQLRQDEMRLMEQGLRDVVDSIRGNLNVGTNASNTTKSVNPEREVVTHIKNTHPELMQYRYTQADPTSNSGIIQKASFNADFVLLQENGTRFWAKNTYMIDWVFDDTGTSGEYNVREAFKAVLGRKASPSLVLDVGSNSGLFSLISALYGTKRIYAFDPQPLCAQYVAESAQINGFGDRVAVINAFVSKHDNRTSPIPVGTCSGEFNVDTGTEFNETVEIPSVNLDDPEEVDLTKFNHFMMFYL